MDAASTIVKYDVVSGSRVMHDFGPTVSCGEPVFVPAEGCVGEDEGYLMTFTHDSATGRSSFVVLDASDLRSAPIATVPLPQRVPNGFHGSWFADE
jgi:carotenoid cleavage dioxygenase